MVQIHAIHYTLDGTDTYNTLQTRWYRYMQYITNKMVQIHAIQYKLEDTDT